MPISVTVPSIWPPPPSAPARSRIASPTRKGWASSSTRPANTLPSACCAAIPTNTLVSAPPSTSWPTGTLNSASVPASVVKLPMRSRKYRTTAACAAPDRGSSTLRAFLARPKVAMIPNTQNAAAVPAAMICLGTSCSEKNDLKALCAQADVTAAAIARTSGMIVNRTRRRWTTEEPGSGDQRPAYGEPDPAGQAVGHAGRRRVPGADRRHDAHVTTELDHARAVGEVADGKDDLGDLKGQEHGEDRHVHLRAEEQHVGVEDGESQQDPGDVVRGVRGRRGRA